MFLTNVAPFKREINRLSKGIRFIAKKHCYNKEITQISLLFVLFITNMEIQMLKLPSILIHARQWATDYFLVRMVVPGTKPVENPCVVYSSLGIESLTEY